MLMAANAEQARIRQIDDFFLTLVQLPR